MHGMENIKSTRRPVSYTIRKWYFSWIQIRTSYRILKCGNINGYSVQCLTSKAQFSYMPMPSGLAYNVLERTPNSDVREVAAHIGYQNLQVTRVVS